jgi:peptidoglycan/xylan/chitin deacetylase (PgdA/CDA1 family)
VAFLHGLVPEDVGPEVMAKSDSFFPVTYCVRVVKPSSKRRESVRTGNAVVLAYHRIADLPSDLHHLCTSPSLFHAHCRILRRYFQVLPLPELMTRSLEGALPERAVALTFDDGTVDALTTVAPALESHQLSGTFFINSGVTGSLQESWQDQLERLFLETDGLPEALILDGTPRNIRTLSQRREVLSLLNGKMWPLDASKRSEVLNAVLSQVNPSLPIRESHRLLTADEVRTLASRPGMSIGGHSVHHLQLVHHDSGAQAREVVDDKRVLETLLGSPVEHFAYPYGEYSDSLREVVAAAGYAFAFTVDSGLVQAETDSLRIPRCEVRSPSERDFRSYLESLFDGAR